MNKQTYDNYEEFNDKINLQTIDNCGYNSRVYFNGQIKDRLFGGKENPSSHINNFYINSLNITQEPLSNNPKFNTIIVPTKRYIRKLPKAKGGLLKKTKKNKIIEKKIIFRTSKNRVNDFNEFGTEECLKGNVNDSFSSDPINSSLNLSSNTSQPTYQANKNSPFIFQNSKYIYHKTNLNPKKEEQNSFCTWNEILGNSNVDSSFENSFNNKKGYNTTAKVYKKKKLIIKNKEDYPLENNINFGEEIDDGVLDGENLISDLSYDGNTNSSKTERKISKIDIIDNYGNINTDINTSYRTEHKLTIKPNKFYSNKTSEFSL